MMKSLQPGGDDVNSNLNESSAKESSVEDFSNNNNNNLNVSAISHQGFSNIPMFQMNAGGATGIGALPNVNSNFQNMLAGIRPQNFAAASPLLQSNNMLMMITPQQMMAGGIIPLNNMMGLMVPGNMNNMMNQNTQVIKEVKVKRKKPKGRPKRPLSAYNIYFKDERQKILKEIPGDHETAEANEKITWPGKKRPPHGKISFESLAKTIGARWKALGDEELAYYKKKADEDLERYASEMKAYEEKLKSNPDAYNETEQYSGDDDSTSNKNRKRLKKNLDSSDSSGNKGNKVGQQNLLNLQSAGNNFLVPVAINPGMISTQSLGNNMNSTPLLNNSSMPSSTTSLHEQNKTNPSA